jgi:hypothetical protein
MDIWSKGLGRLVLQMRLSERSDMKVEGADLVMRGTMGKPTFWDWSVNLGEEDVVDFLVLLKRPEMVRYLVEDPARWTLLRAAAKGALFFAWQTARLALFGAPASATLPAAASPMIASDTDTPSALPAPSPSHARGDAAATPLEENR